MLKLLKRIFGIKEKSMPPADTSRAYPPSYYRNISNTTSTLDPESFKSSQSDFGTSFAVGMMTSNAGLGYAAGGDIGAAILGSTLGESIHHTTDSYVPSTDYTAPSVDYTPSTDYTSISSSSDSTSYSSSDSSSYSSSDSSSSFSID